MTVTIISTGLVWISSFRAMTRNIFLTLGVALTLVLAAPPPVMAGSIEGVVSAPLKHSGGVVVYIDGLKGDSQPPEKHAVVSQEFVEFIPFVTAILVGTIVDFPNDDLRDHNVFTPSKVGKKFDLGRYGPGLTKSVKFEKSGVVPLLCRLHNEMEAYIVVLENTYFDLTTKDGKFQITDVPPGRYKLTTWHPRLRSQSKRVVVEAKGASTVNFEPDM